MKEREEEEEEEEEWEGGFDTMHCGCAALCCLATETQANVEKQLKLKGQFADYRHGHSL